MQYNSIQAQTIMTTTMAMLLISLFLIPYNSKAQVKPGWKLSKKYAIDGTLLLKGYLNENGKREGNWFIYHNNGQVRDITYFKNGLMWNAVASYDQYGKKLNPGTLKNGQGTNYDYRKDGSMIYKVEIKNGDWHGQYISYWENGVVSSRMTHKNGKQHGKSIIYNKEGNILVISNYKDEQLHGEYTMKTAEGKIKKQGKYIEGKKEGKWLMNGKIVFYKNGKEVK